MHLFSLWITFLVVTLSFSVSIRADHHSTTSKNDRPPAQRIIALSPHAVEMLFAIGVGERIVATVEYADFPDAANTIKRIGSYAGIQIEQVVALQPDLIVAWRSGNRAEDLAKLDSLGLPIYYTHPQTIEQVFSDLLALGDLTGQQVQADKVVKQLQKEYRNLVALYKDKKEVSVFYQLWHEPMRTVGRSSWIDSMISDCNGRNVFNEIEEGYPLIAFESVVVKNPEVIIIPHHSGAQGAKTAFWNNWQQVSAVKNQKMSVINGDLLHRFSPRAIQGLSLLCQAIDAAR